MEKGTLELQTQHCVELKRKCADQEKALEALKLSVQVIKKGQADREKALEVLKLSTQVIKKGPGFIEIYRDS